jgi:hypothetical protein
MWGRDGPPKPPGARGAPAKPWHPSTFGAGGPTQRWHPSTFGAAPL